MTIYYNCSKLGGMIFAFNLIVNSFLSFATVALLIQLLLQLRVKNARLEALLLFIPLLKLALDLFLYDFDKWALWHEINPLEQPPGTRRVTLQLWIPTFFSFFTADGYTFTPADIAYLLLPYAWIQGVVCLTAVISLLRLSFWGYRMACAKKELNRMRQRARPCGKVLQGLRAPIDLFLSDDVAGPCAFGRAIFFPASLSLTQEEFEAITQHELEHLRFFDGALRLFCSLLAALFWWVPTKWWLKKMEERQEMACDRKAEAPLALASAILKASRSGSKSPLLCFASKGALAKRLKPLLQKPEKKRLWRCAIAALAALSLIGGKFWIF